MPERPIGPAQREVLCALEEAPMTSSEIARWVAFTMLRKLRPTADAENVAGTLRRLEARSLATPHGTYRVNGRSVWSITEAGRKAIAVAGAEATEDDSNGD